MSEINDILQNAVNEALKKETSLAKEFVEHPEITSLIKRLIEQNMNEKEILRILNKIAKREDIKKEFNITKNILISKKHIAKIVSEAKKEIKMKKNENTKDISQSNRNISNNTSQANNIQGAGKANPILKKDLDL